MHDVVKRKDEKRKAQRNAAFESSEPRDQESYIELVWAGRPLLRSMDTVCVLEKLEWNKIVHIFMKIGGERLISDLLFACDRLQVPLLCCSTRS